jgi:hypothetical protein
MSDMTGKAAQVAVERSGRLPRYKADRLLALNDQLPTTHFLIPNSYFILSSLSAIFRASMAKRNTKSAQAPKFRTLLSKPSPNRGRR